MWLSRWRCFTTKPDALSSIPSTHMVVKKKVIPENWPPHSWCSNVAVHCMQTHRKQIRVWINKQIYSYALVTLGIAETKYSLRKEGLVCSHSELQSIITKNHNGRAWSSWSHCIAVSRQSEYCSLACFLLLTQSWTLKAGYSVTKWGIVFTPQLT